MLKFIYGNVQRQFSTTENADDSRQTLGKCLRCGGCGEKSCWRKKEGFSGKVNNKT